MRVSVVIPVYNAADVLRRCLGSIAEQTFRDFEVIAVDDGSTDGSGELLERAAETLPRLRVIRQRNQGQSVARNVALAEARGEYVLMVDADDFVHPRLLELAVGLADRKGLDFVLFDHRKARPDECDAVRDAWRSEAPAAEAGEIAGDAFEWFVRSRRWPMPWQFLFRRSSLAGLSFSPGVIYEDVPFVFTYLAGHSRGAHLGNRLYCYVRTEGSTTHADNWQRRIAGHEAGMRTLAATLEPRQYRLYVTFGCSGWIRCLWREILRLPRSSARTAALAEMRRFLARSAADGLLRARDFRGIIWRLRFLLAAWGGSRR